MLCKSVFLEGVLALAGFPRFSSLLSGTFSFFFFLMLSAAIFLSFNSSFPLHGMYVRQVVVDAGRDQSELTVCSVRTCRVWVTLECGTKGDVRSPSLLFVSFLGVYSSEPERREQRLIGWRRD